MKRVGEFAASHPDVVHVRFIDLLDDCRDVVECIAHRLDVPLHAGDQADEMDRFLENGVRNHAQLAASSGENIRALYRTFLSLCD